MDVSDEMDKSWDRPWSTEEMRKKRREWSLAGDAGLLKHLQQFSENLLSRINKTEEAIDTITNQLDETVILIDNVANTSLALANTQFIESRVQEDDIEIEKKSENLQQNSKDPELVTADLIASVSESVRKGLSIMDEKYNRMEVIDSDTEDEDDAIVLSVILGSKDPYQDRPLPYIIGSEKWQASSKIGLESSSSESEQLDEEEEEEEEKDESESGKDDEHVQVFENTNDSKTNITQLSSSSTKSDNYNNHTSDMEYINNKKLDNISQNTTNFISESTTPSNIVPKVQISNEITPNFAQELAKRLGNVRQAQKPNLDETKESSSINRFEDDLFPSEDNDLFGNKSGNSSGNKAIFDDQISAKLWKEKSNNFFHSNIIPPSIDVPPPICAISMKPKSAIDDLFGDADSEDSVDIFSSKNSLRKITKDDTAVNIEEPSNKLNIQNKFLLPKTSSNMMTSTPEMNVNTDNLFSDEEDDGGLFSTSKRESHKSDDVLYTSSADLNNKKLVGDVSTFGDVLSVNNKSKLSNRIPQHQSSCNETVPNDDSCQSNEYLSISGFQNTAGIDTFNQSFIIEAGNASSLVESIDNSSGISIQPHSINNTAGSSIAEDFHPQMTSTRLKSEEIYRERIASDSLFTPHSRESDAVNSNSIRGIDNQSRTQEQSENISSFCQDDVFENEDLFGPPPLPKTDSKSKSKMSFFDESDSGDELFSTTSSGSRSQKSTDFLATTPQYPDKIRTSHRRGLFDEDIDIFGSKDSPDVNIFGITPKLPTYNENHGSKKMPEIVSETSSGVKANSSSVSKESNFDNVSQAKLKPKTNSLFDDDDDIYDTDLFDVKIGKNEHKNDPYIFDDHNDLFSTKKVADKEKSIEKKNLSNKEIVTSVTLETNDLKKNVTLLEKSTESKSNDFFSVTIAKSNEASTRDFLFEDDDLFGKKRETKDESVVKTSESHLENKKKIMNNSVISKESSIKLDTSSSVLDSNTVATIERQHLDMEISSHEVTNNEAEELIQDKEIIDNVAVDTGYKKHPPKTLNIRAAVQSSAEESSQAPRRAVSGKIKDLMGKMGDFKILSPTDTPPLWRKSEEKTDEECDAVDRDSDDGGCSSRQVQASYFEDSASIKAPILVPTTNGSNVETAVSFDEPVQVETLSTASKSRVRIQAKRRPQSRHARKSALRYSGVDFDTVDTISSNEQEDNSDSSHVSKEMLNSTTGGIMSNVDRLTVSTVGDSAHRSVDLNISIATDDKSELGSVSKESSMSANKNTLLSPSTDEEDLFDVPPDLPEDPQKEDTLFGRAPILSPVENILTEKISSYMKPLRDTIINTSHDNEGHMQNIKIETQIDECSTSIVNNKNVHIETKKIINDETKFEDFYTSKTYKNKNKESEKASVISKNNNANVFEKESTEEPMDPLRDNSHDPLEDPSQLFAFVTKTPSPEKGKNLLFSEDDSLFSNGSKKTIEERSPKKQVLDLFADDAEGDLFSAPLVKSIKKPMKDTKISLFDEDTENEEDDNLFGSIRKKISLKGDSEKSIPTEVSQKKTNIFEDDGEITNLFSETLVQSQSRVAELPSKGESLATGRESIKSSNVNDIFGDQSSGEDDIFISKKPVTKKSAPSKSLFSTDSDDDDYIFGKSSSFIDTKTTVIETRPILKKPITRDLKKTAEKIVEDPLSIFQDD